MPRHLTMLGVPAVDPPAWPGRDGERMAKDAWLLSRLKGRKRNGDMTVDASRAAWRAEAPHTRFDPKDWPRWAIALAMAVKTDEPATKRGNFGEAGPDYEVGAWYPALDMLLSDVLPRSVRHALNYSGEKFTASTLMLASLKAGKTPADAVAVIVEKLGTTPGAPSLGQFAAGA